MKLLGRGLFGRVTLVLLRQTKQAFALKVQRSRSGGSGGTGCCAFAPHLCPFYKQELRKSRIMANAQQDNVLHEKRILQLVSHPCVLALHKTFRTPRTLFMLTELLPVRKHACTTQRVATMLLTVCVFVCVGVWRC